MHTSSTKPFLFPTSCAHPDMLHHQLDTPHSIPLTRSTHTTHCCQQGTPAASASAAASLSALPTSRPGQTPLRLASPLQLLTSASQPMDTYISSTGYTASARRLTAAAGTGTAAAEVTSEDTKQQQRQQCQTSHNSISTSKHATELLLQLL